MKDPIWYLREKPEPGPPRTYPCPECGTQTDPNSSPSDAGMVCPKCYAHWDWPEETPQRRRCDTCLWWVKRTSVDLPGRPHYGLCRRLPPIGTENSWHWPTTYEQEWCGEWVWRDE